MKSHSSDKKHGKTDNHKSNHKAEHKPDHKDQKGGHRADHKADKHADKHAEKGHPEAEKQGKGAKKEKGRAGAAVAVQASQAHPDEKPTRLALIKTRHEAMKREIDQIREDLESDEDE